MSKFNAIYKNLLLSAKDAGPKLANNTAWLSSEFSKNLHGCFTMAVMAIGAMAIIYNNAVRRTQEIEEANNTMDKSVYEMNVFKGNDIVKQVLTWEICKIVKRNNAFDITFEGVEYYSRLIKKYTFTVDRLNEIKIIALNTDTGKIINLDYNGVVEHIKRCLDSKNVMLTNRIEV